MREELLLINNPLLLNEWDFNKNIDLEVKKISCGSHKKVWWKCKEGHEWESCISNRYNGRGCPYCTGKKVSEKNSIYENSEKLTNEWDYEKNFPLTPKDVSIGSKKPIWWKCNKDHSWKIDPGSRIFFNSGCPYCSNKKVGIDNNLLIDNPFLCKEWDYEKNTLNPYEVLPKSKELVWWKCDSCEHSWRAKINHRNGAMQSGCPKCNRSKGEKTVESFLKEKNIRYKTEFSFPCLYGTKGGSLRFDFMVYGEDKKVLGLIEFDGDFHFRKVYKNDNYEIIVAHDNIKNSFCSENNLPLLRINFKEKDIENVILKFLGEIGYENY